MGLKECMREKGPQGRWLSTVNEEPTSAPDAAYLRGRMALYLRGEREAALCDDWSSIGALVRSGEDGMALRLARTSIFDLIDLFIVEEPQLFDGLGSLFPALDPLLVTPAELACACGEEGAAYLHAVSPAERATACEYINVIRRALTDLGVQLFSLDISALLDELRTLVDELLETRNFLVMLPAGDDERLRELADHLASAESGLAAGLMRLFSVNAANPEVRRRFHIVWQTVEADLGAGSETAALRGAVAILDAAFLLAGLDDEDLMQRLDMAAAAFLQPDLLKEALKEAEEPGAAVALTPAEGVAAMRAALEQIGLVLGGGAR